LNNDTWLDIVVDNNSTHSINVLFGNEKGSFEIQKTYSTGYDSFPYSVAIGDFNNDNQMDVAVANYGTDNIGIFLGQRNDILASQITFSTNLGSGPYFITVSNLNNDDQLDIIVANYHADNIGIFLGYVNGTFAIQETYFLGLGSNPCSVASGYIDPDHQIDIVVSNNSIASVSVLVRYGNGTFATPKTHFLTVKSIPIGLVVGDFNNDNQSDVAVSNSDTNNIIILIKYTSISSENPTSYSVGNGSNPLALVMGYLNNDNYLDIGL
jgi:hypothetical protein